MGCNRNRIVFSFILSNREGLSTALVFKNLNLQTCNPTKPVDILHVYQSTGALAAAKKGFLINDLEPPAFICEPKLAQIRDNIVDSGISYDGVMMSGSGTSIYGLIRDANAKGDDTKKSEQILQQYDGLQFFACKFICKPDTVTDWYQ